MAALCLCVAIQFITSFLEPCHAAITVLAWGNNTSGQCTVPSHPSPLFVAGVAGGLAHSVTFETNGTVVSSWGDNTYGELTPPPNLQSVVAIAAGNGFTLALQSNGVVTSWGSRTTVPVGLTDAVAIAASLDNLMALKSDGSVITWGVVAAPPASVTNVVAIAAGNQHCLALRGDGSVVGWGDNTAGQITIPSGLTNVVALAAGASNSLALQSDGTVVAWGDNTWEQSSVPAGLQNVVAIAAGARHCLALKQNGSVVAWGDNSYSQSTVPGNATDISAIAAGSYHSLAVIANGLPVITVQPVAQYDPVAETAAFTVVAVGAAPLNYQWQQNGTNIPGATGSILVLTNYPVSAGGTFSVTVSNSLGTITSASVQLPPAWHAPAITAQPQGVTVTCGNAASFQTAATGTAPLAYQWQLGGANVPGATNYTLSLASVSGNSAGNYTVVVTNTSGSATSQVAALTVVSQPPSITSKVTASGKQGSAFNYTITGLYNPTFFAASGLPTGLSLNSTNGRIQGTPLVSGVFTVGLVTINNCSSATTNLVLSIASDIPAITSSLTATGTEEVAFNYQIKASNVPAGFGAANLPVGLVVDPTKGIISGTPVYAGSYNITLFASNVWGVGSAVLQLTVSNAPIQGLSIVNVQTNYTSPYLLNFTFSLRNNVDPTVGDAVVVDPSLLTLTAFEDGQPIDPSETSVLIEPASDKVLKAFLVLDFTESVAAATGAVDSNGVPIGVDTEVAAAQAFVNEQPAGTQVGVYEFHREDENPQLVQSLTANKTLLDNAIAGVWTNYVQSLPAGSRCWDALVAAINALGPTNSDEVHSVVFCSDGGDTSSSNTLQNVITAATNASVQVYCAGFGDSIDTANLQAITTPTLGRYYEATNLTDLTVDFALIGKDLGGQYVLRWATLQRGTNAFMPSFQITYQGFTVTSPDNPPPFISGTNYVVDNTTTPPTTNTVYVYSTNYIMLPYQPSAYAGDVTAGSLRLAADAAVQASSVTLRATYAPRYIRQMHLHYVPNWPCTVALQSTNPGQQLYGWTFTQTNDGTGGQWLTLSSSNTLSLASSIPFGSFGPLLTFQFRDVLNSSNAFSAIDIDNTIYTNTGGQSFTFENTNAFITVYPVLPFSTPVPWLIQYGFTNAVFWASDETNDFNGSGLLVWQDYVAGLNPTNAGPGFVIGSPVPSGSFNHYQITFPTSLNRTYRVYTSSDLRTWQTLQDNIAGTGATVTIIDSRFIPAPVYYRVAVY